MWMFSRVDVTDMMHNASSEHLRALVKEATAIMERRRSYMSSPDLQELAKNKSIDAIKAVRLQFDLSLGEAKAVVDDYLDDYIRLRK